MHACKVDKREVKVEYYGVLRVGFHLSIEGSIDRVFDRALELNCNTLQMFSRNPRGWHSKKLDAEEIERFGARLSESEVWPVFIHTPYLLNLASPNESVYHKSVEVLKDELDTAALLGVPFIVTHLGSHVGYGKKSGFKRITDAVNSSFWEVENKVSVLLENTAGTRNSMGSSLEDIKYILSGIEDETRIGVCFDTCHAFAAGYDLVSRRAVEETLRRFDEVIGLKELKLVHLNDSKGGLGSRIDRHEHIGLGMIGEEGFRNILKSNLRTLPLILETPVNEKRNDVENLKKIKELAQ
jgi:deoxyribonuclease-4